MENYNNQQELQEKINQLHIVKNNSLWPKKTLILYFPDKKSEIENCFNDDKLKEDCQEQLQKLISNEIFSSLQPLLPFYATYGTISDSLFLHRPVISETKQSTSCIVIAMHRYSYTRTISHEQKLYSMKISNNGERRINFPSIIIDTGVDAVKLSYDILNSESKKITLPYKVEDENTNSKEIIDAFTTLSDLLMRCKPEKLVECDEFLFKKISTIDNDNNMSTQAKNTKILEHLNYIIQTLKTNGTIIEPEKQKDDDGCWSCFSCCNCPCWPKKETKNSLNNAINLDQSLILGIRGG